SYCTIHYLSPPSSPTRRSSDLELATLPQGRAPTRQDWQSISRRIRGLLDARIAMMERTRGLLDGCIGCGCLSLSKCALYNRNDRSEEHTSELQSLTNIVCRLLL